VSEFEMLGDACFTSLLALDDTLVAGNRLGVSAYDLQDGEPRYAIDVEGIVGRIDASSDGRTLALSLVTTDLIDLEPGVFEAHGAIARSPTWRVQQDYAIGGALLTNQDFSPGYITVPHAIHPDGRATAYFKPDERLFVAGLNQHTELLLQDLSDEVLTQDPRTEDLPAVIDFTPDGRWLLVVRGRWLSVFDCGAS
jgi:hypothetical protein